MLLVFAGLAFSLATHAQSILTPAFTGSYSVGSNAAVKIPPITLTNTPAAPLNAGGSAELKHSAVLSLNIHGLNPGSFRVLAVRKSDHSIVQVGMLALGNPTVVPDEQANEDQRQESLTHQEKGLQSSSDLRLPADLPTSDVAKIIVADKGGNDLLVGRVQQPKSNPKNE